MSIRTKLAALCAACAVAGLSACDGSDKNNNEMKDQTSTPIENIMTRASVRRFTDRPVSADTLETIVKAGMAAPTAVNKQPWEFVVVTDRTLLDSLAAHHPYSNLTTATAAIIVCGNMDKALDGLGREYWVQDCSAASENILLAAHALGLGAVWCGVYPMPERIQPIKETLGLPESVTPLNLISMGYPAVDPEPKDKWNPEAVHYNKW